MWTITVTGRTVCVGTVGYGSPHVSLKAITLVPKYTNNYTVFYVQATVMQKYASLIIYM